MNKIHRVLWNKNTLTFVAVAETAKSAGKGAKGATDCNAAGTLASGAEGGIGAAFHLGLKSLLTAFAGAGLCWSAAFAQHVAPTQLPTGGQVMAGTAKITQIDALMAITQSSQRAAINWQSFNVGSQAKINITQPSSSSVLLNRILGNSASQIYGQINANGQVIMSNPSGVYFSPTATVDVHSFTATTHGISDTDFMAGIMKFNRNGATGKIVNDGQISAALGGYVALLAPEVRNGGLVVAKLGTVALAAGDSFELEFNKQNSLTNILVSPATMATLVENGHAVQAPGGLIILSAQAANQLQSGVVKNSGSLQATGFVNNGGVIRLSASRKIENTGTITADAAPGSKGKGGDIVLIADFSNPDSTAIIGGTLSAKGGDLGGDGGFVETSGSKVSIQDDAKVITLAPKGKTGTWLVDPTDFTISSGTGNQVTNGTASGIGATTLQNSLATSDVSITTNNTAGTDSGDLNVNAAVSWSANTTLSLSAYRDVNVNAAISATGTSSGLNITSKVGPGTGTINLGANITTGGDQTYNGSVVVNGTDIALSSTTGGLSIVGGVSVGTVGAGKLTITSATASNVSDAMTGSLQLVKAGAGTLTLIGNNTFTGGTTVSAGTLEIGNGTTGGTSFTGNIVNSGVVNFNLSAATTIAYSNIISGTGSLTKLGAGTLSLSGANTYSGGTTFSAGTLKAGSATALGTGAVAIGSSGVLDLTYSGTVSLGSTLSMSSGAAITNSVNTSNLSVAGTSSLVGNINTAGNQTYTGAVTLSGNTTLTTLDTSQVNTNGTITFGGAVDGTASGAQSLTVTSGTGAVSFGSTVGNTAALSSITISGGATSTEQTTTLGGNVTTSGNQSFGGNLTLDANTVLTSTANSGNGSVTIAGAVNSTSVGGVSSGIIEFLGSGYWGLSTTNGSTWAYYLSNSTGKTYQSSISVGSANYISTLASNSSLPSILYSSGNYSWNPATTATVSYLVVGGGGGGSSGGGGGGGVLQSTSMSASSAVTYAITVGAGGAGSSSIGTLNGTNGGNSSITGSGLTSVIAYGGGGGSRGAFQNVTAGSDGSSGGGGGSQSTPASPGGAAIYGSQGFAGGATNNASFTAGGGGGAGSVGGAGTSTAGGSGGSGVLGNISTSLSATTSNYFGGGGGGGTYYGTSAGANIQGTGGSGGGASSGKTTTNAGITNSGGGGGGQCFTSCSGLGGAGGSGIVALSGSLLNLFTQNSYSLTIKSGTGAAQISGSVSNLTALDINSKSASNLVSGAIGGSAALSYNSAVGYTGSSGATGVLNLAGTNTYTGGTTVSGGTLQAGSTTAFGGASGALTVNTGAVLDLNGKALANANSLSLNGTGISAGGALKNSSVTGATYAGLVALGSNSSIVGDTGTIALSNVGNLTGAFALTLGGTQGGSVASIIGTDTGTLVKEGAGTWTLAGANTYSGGTTISAGTLKAGSATAFGTGVVGVTSGATLDLNGQTMTSTGVLTLNGTGISSGGALKNSSVTGATYAGLVALGSNSSIVG
ncbi:MAG: autotransporter-associated beta strand repeat-containing protein, partial [Burkholderiales bacterium]|nr:autotransporter-associated beta strand repeat-containing protein [Burkholderiales bacterium]